MVNLTVSIISNQALEIDSDARISILLALFLTHGELANQTAGNLFGLAAKDAGGNRGPFFICRLIQTLSFGDEVFLTIRHL